MILSQRRMLNAVSIFFLSISLCIGFNYDSNPRFSIDQGVLEGQYLYSATQKFCAFTKIPYAAPPFADLRFKEPQPARPWKTTLNATLKPPPCPQINIVLQGDYTGEEDCLYLNVYTPQLNQSTSYQFPVMIYFHAGGFEFGAGTDFQPQILLNRKIVLVTANYRLGPLGFLSTADEVVPGNNGLKDQNLAIKWVKSNIHYFGGNQNKITIFGLSAGGTSTHYHMLSPLSKDLINGVISQSGVAISFWGLSSGDQGKMLATSLAKLVNCPVHDSYEMVDCLRNISAREIIKKALDIPFWNPNKIGRFRPVIEPRVKGAFISEHPIEIIKLGKIARVPFMVGISADDGSMVTPMYFRNRESTEEFNRLFDTIVPANLEFEFADVKYILNQIKQFYFNNKSITYDDFSRKQTTNMYTDRMFLAPLNEVVRLHLNYTNQPIYNYVFSYRGTRSLSEIYGDPYKNYGVSHGDETIYLSYPYEIFGNYTFNCTEEAISENIVGLWTNFATYGNPTPLSNKWTPVKSKNLEYFRIISKNESKMQNRLYHNRMKFWESLNIEW